MKKQLQNLLQLGREIELRFSELSLDSSEVQYFLKQYQSLVHSTDPQVVKIGESASKISDKWEIQHFINFLIPIERYLGHRITDTEILIPTADKDSLLAASYSSNSEEHSEEEDFVSQRQSSSLVLICDNIRSAFNVGSFFRTAECFGVQEVWLTGYTPTPENEKVIQTAMKTHEWVKWRHFQTLSAAISEAKNSLKKVVALEITNKSQNLSHSNLNGHMAVIVGNERFGISPVDLAQCDQILSIPLFGRKNSLNVGISFGIFCYEWQRQLQLQRCSV